MITVNNTVPGPIQDIELLGNTVQDPNNLADIKSVCDLQEEGQYKLSILSCNKNLFDGELETGSLNTSNGINNDSTKDRFIRSLNYHKVNGNQSYILSPSLYFVICEYDKDLKFIKFNSGYSFVTTNNTKYIRFHRESTDLNLKIQLEEGTQATPYTPHEYNKSSILLPCQLGNGDRLYYDNVEGAWCIDKVETKILFKDLIWGLGEDKGLTFKVGSNLPFVSAYDYIISDKYKKGSVAEESNQTQIILFKHSGRSEVRVALAKSEYQSISSLNDAIAYMGKSEGYILVKSPVPQKIILPLNVQIQLNSFLDTTHIYTTDTEIEPTIRATVPKSLGASVESLHNKTDEILDRVSDIEGLKASQDMKYSTDTGYLVCNETMDGVVKDIKIQGKTVIVDAEGNIVEAGTEGAILKSVGEDVDTMEVLSSNENLFNPNMMFELGNLNIITGNVDYHADRIVTDFIKIPSSTKLTRNVPVGFGCVWNGFYNANKEYLGESSAINANSYTSPQNACYVRYIFVKTGLATSGEDQDIVRKSSKLEIGDLSTPYVVPKKDKKAILYQDKETQEWLPVPSLPEWDLVDSLENKWYKRSEKVVLNGSEAWSLNSGLAGTNTLMFELKNIQNDTNIVCNIFKKLNAGNLDEEGIILNKQWSSISIRILKSKLETPDVAGFKKWLQANNVSVVYQLAQEQVYDIAPLNVDAYANKTMISCVSGAVVPSMEFSITTYINNLVKQNRQDIKQLQNDFYTYSVVQNRRQLASTYSADSVTFKVDFNSTKTMTEEGNADLYKLIEDNIIVGKDNYDYDKMFSIIMDYVVWMELTWDQFDVLVGIMDYQHNPPVEEVPEEI